MKMQQLIQFGETEQAIRVPVMNCSNTSVATEGNRNPYIFCHSRHECHFFNPIFSMDPSIPGSIKDAQNLPERKVGFRDPKHWSTRQHRYKGMSKTHHLQQMIAKFKIDTTYHSTFPWDKQWIPP